MPNNKLIINQYKKETLLVKQGFFKNIQFSYFLFA